MNKRKYTPRTTTSNKQKAQQVRFLFKGGIVFSIKLLQQLRRRGFLGKRELSLLDSILYCLSDIYNDCDLNSKAMIKAVKNE